MPATCAGRLSTRCCLLAWTCIVYPYQVGEELVADMARAGCVEVSLGFESGSPVMLKNMNKRFSPDDVRHAARLFHKHGIKLNGYLLLGGPGETRETVLESLAFADSLPLDFLKITTGIRIYPETELARAAVAEGVIAADDDLLLPRFYLAHGLDGWIQEEDCPLGGLAPAFDGVAGGREFTRYLSRAWGLQYKEPDNNNSNRDGDVENRRNRIGFFQRFLPSCFFRSG